MADLLLGGQIDPAQHQRTDKSILVASGDLTTHGVIVGMTGSGKTGLGVVLIEEVLSAGIPTLLIDPKGDLTNLCLMFPWLDGPSFAPWVNEGDAEKAGQSVTDFAAAQAESWRNGLSGWGVGGERIAKLRDSVEFTIYTPGSAAGVGLNIVGSLAAPAGGTDPEVLADEIEGFVSGLLGLVGIDADPLSSREHILLSNLVLHEWSNGRSLDIAALVGMVQQPPIRKLGVFEIDQFFPPKDRTAFALRLNGLLASPSFAAWMSGSTLDMDSLLRTPEGKPRCAIITTAHLGDQERQFVTTLVLGKLVTWMRRQSGTTDLRAMLYMDEVAGYLPPTAAPPTKKPIMTLMKQARAFGVGVVLSTQNPVDVDYKALSNAGTWMIGRLQTDRDKQRLLDGMSAASGGVDVKAVGDTISGLAKREFVLRRAGKDQPEVFTTRWAMSYLRGPLTRDQISTLMTEQRAKAAAAAPAPIATSNVAGVAGEAAGASAVPSPVGDLGHDETTLMPEIADGTAVRWVDTAAPWLAEAGADPNGTRWEAAMLARVLLRFEDTRAGFVHDDEYEAVLFPLADQVDVSRAVDVDYDDRDLRPQPPTGAVYRLPAAPVKQKTLFTRIERELLYFLVRSKSVEMLTNRELKLFGRPGEAEDEFRARCEQVADQRADEETAKLRDRYESKAQALRQQLMVAEDRVEVLEVEAKGRRNEELMSTAGSILGGLLGGRSRGSILGSVVGRAGAVAGRRTRTQASGKRLDAASNKVEALQQQVDDLEQQAADEVATIDAKWRRLAADITTTPVSLKRTNAKIVHTALVWLPVS
ncbi:MAG: ATP-binding protein [Actinomycetota bacterium]